MIKNESYIYYKQIENLQSLNIFILEKTFLYFVSAVFILLLMVDLNILIHTLEECQSLYHTKLSKIIKKKQKIFP